jgi:hypothetical protein
MTNDQLQKPSDAYNAALATFRLASTKFTEAQKAYRARTIGDDAFLKAKAEFEKAQAAMDEAETKEIAP